MTLRNCAQCEKEFSLPPSKAIRAHVFCSRECFQADRASHQIVVTCAECGKVFQSVKALEHRKRYCSKTCQHKAMGTHNTLPPRAITCPICGAPFHAAGSKKLAHKTCSPECARVARGSFLRGRDSRIEKPCVICGVSFKSYAYRNRQCCSQVCRKNFVAQKNTGAIRSSTFVRCDHCGKSRKLYRSRQKTYAGNFCNMQCYLASKQSGAERKVAAWLDAQHIPYQRQYKLGRRTVDFWISGTVVEVNGCYWHGCSSCWTADLNDMQRRRIASDKILHTYCQNRDIPIITLWEHDINRDDFSVITALHL